MIAYYEKKNIESIWSNLPEDYRENRSCNKNLSSLALLSFSFSSSPVLLFIPSVLCSSSMLVFTFSTIFLLLLFPSASFQLPSFRQGSPSLWLIKHFMLSKIGSDIAFLPVRDQLRPQTPTNSRRRLLNKIKAYQKSECRSERENYYFNKINLFNMLLLFSILSVLLGR